MRLWSAYDWTNDAGELPELRAATGEALERYAADSEANAREHGEIYVHAEDLLALREWLLEHEPGEP
jgi:hypothetical protein